MAILVTIKLTIAGADTGPNFDIFAYNLDPNFPIFQNITKDQLLNGYTCDVPDNTQTIRVKSTGTCDSAVDLTVNC